MSCVPMSELGAADHWQAGFLAVLPAVVRRAKFRFRHLRAERRQEAIQETIARACVSYQRLVSQGNLEALRASTLAEFSVRRVRGGRLVGGRKNSRDVLGRLASQKYGFEVQSLASWCDDQSEWQATLIESKRVLPADLAAFRVDFERWLSGFDGRHRLIITALASGERTAVVADQFGLTAGRISQLRRQYERLWLDFQGERPASERVPTTFSATVARPIGTSTRRRCPGPPPPARTQRKVVVHG